MPHPTRRAARHKPNPHPTGFLRQMAYRVPETDTAVRKAVSEHIRARKSDQKRPVLTKANPSLVHQLAILANNDPIFSHHLKRVKYVFINPHGRMVFTNISKGIYPRFRTDDILKIRQTLREKK